MYRRFDGQKFLKKFLKVCLRRADRKKKSARPNAGRALKGRGTTRFR
ncbi:hypothetical protein HMPREF3036_02345 [Sutterella sp. KLE1602]|nr:hypothetical protein HMPREF3036_02345 [Sutterella sp. KLE1602]